MQPCACNWYWRATGLWLRRGVQIGTFTLFQETYHRDTFRKMHVSGPKSDYNHRLLTQVRRAIGVGSHRCGKRCSTRCLWMFMTAEGRGGAMQHTALVDVHDSRGAVIHRHQRSHPHRHHQTTTATNAINIFTATATAASAAAPRGKSMAFP
eukprot:349922-Chlamydomonas_euryale.AAC.3